MHSNQSFFPRRYILMKIICRIKLTFGLLCWNTVYRSLLGTAALGFGPDRTETSTAFCSELVESLQTSSGVLSLLTQKVTKREWQEYSDRRRKKLALQRRTPTPLSGIVQVRTVWACRYRLGLLVLFYKYFNSLK